MRFNHAKGRQVVSTATAATVGIVNEFVIDPQTRAVVALTLKKTDDADTLHWSDITAFGADAVTVSGTDKLIVAPPELVALSGKDHRILGKRVLTSTGDELGTVDDVEFEPDTGTITAIILADDQIAGVRLIGIGSYAVIVHAETAAGAT
jgi:sporulation protein YlmC with PRC-barrel domain